MEPIQVINGLKFKERIGFHRRVQRNESLIVYDKTKGGSYIEAAINQWGISDEQLYLAVAKRLKQSVDQAVFPRWPPSADNMSEFSKPVPELMKFLTFLRNPGKQNFADQCLDPKICMLNDLLLSYISGKRTHLKVNTTSSVSLQTVLQFIMI